MIALRWTALAAAAALLAVSGPSYASHGPPKPGKCAVAAEVGAPSDGAGALAPSIAGLLLAAGAVARRRR